jgi:hypothetical protein
LIGVIAGWATLNMASADSGLAILHHHTAPLHTYLSRLCRQRKVRIQKWRSLDSAAILGANPAY